MAVDADAGFGYIFAAQRAWADVIPSPLTPKHEYKTSYSPSQPVFGGNIEITPIPFFSCRAGGSVSLSRNRTIYGRELGARSLPWDVVSDLKTWEVAGLLNLWRGRGYRFSLVGGYKEEFWDYSGDPLSDFETPGGMNDEFNNHTPFMGLQTALFFPLWKARFELIGSPFMLQKVNNNVWQGAEFVDYRAELDQGGLIEIDMEGSTMLLANLRLGMYFNYSYLELEGMASFNDSGNLSLSYPNFRFHTSHNSAELGFKLNLNF